MPDSRAAATYLRTGPEFVGNLRRVVEDAKNGDPLARVSIVTPSYYSSFYLRRAISANGLFNVEFVRIEDIAEELARDHLASRGTRSLTRLRAGEMVYAAGQEARLEGPLKGVTGLPSFHSALHRTLNDLEAERIVGASGQRTRITGASLAVHGPVSRDLAAVWDAYDIKKAGKGFHDRTEVAHAASAAVRARALESPEAKLDYGSLIVLLVAMPAPQYRELWRTLAQAAGVRVVVGLTGDAKSDEALCKAAGLEMPPQDAAGSAPPPARLVSAPDVRSEVAAVTREVFAAAACGVPFNRMAVLYGSSTYAARIEDAFMLAGVPVSGPDSATLAASPAGRFITGVLDIAKSDLSREKVGHWLAAAPVIDPGTGQQVPGSRWDGISRAAGITRGNEQWQQRLEKFASRQADRALRLEETGTEEGDAGLRAEGLRTQAAEATRLRQFMEAFASCLEHEPRSGWGAYRDWLRGIMGRYLYVPDEATAKEAAERVGSTLDGIAELDSLGGEPPEFARFEQVVREELTLARGGRRTLGRGVFVGPLSAAAGCQFDVVHILGLADGSFPPPDRPDPLLPDSVRSQVNEQHGTELPVSAGRLDVRRREFHVALRSGLEAVLSWPRSASAGSRETGPSQWLVDEARRRPENAAVQAGDFLSQPERIACLAIAAATPGAALADGHEYDLLDVLAWPAHSRNGAGQGHFLEQDPETGIAAALELEAGRYGGSWTHWAGDLSRQPAAAWVAGQSVSASRMQTYASCPLSYFFGYVLTVPPTEKPEEAIYLPPDRSGTFVHRVLQHYLGIRMRMKQPSSEKLLDEAFDRVKEDWDRDELTGNRAVWEIEAADLRRRLRRWVSAERELERAGFIPRAAEKGFGRDGSQPTTVSLDNGSSLSFSGVIDRIDMDRSDSTVYVFDYKTGSSSSYRAVRKDPVDGGRRLQLAVYAQAARSIISEAVEVRAAYWFVLDRKPLMLPEPESFDSEGAANRLAEVVQVVRDGIASGHFPPNPGKSAATCLFCPYNRVCPSGIRRQRMLDVHTEDPRLRPYFNLTSPADGDAQ